MKRFAMRFGSVIVTGTLVLGLFGCKSPSNADHRMGLSPQKIPHSVSEHDADGKEFSINPKKTNKVDAHSTLTVSFPKPPEVKPDNPPPEWTMVESTYNYLIQCGNEWNELNSRNPDKDDSTAREKLRSDLIALDGKARTLVNYLTDTLGLKSKEATDIFLGRAKGISRPSANGNAYFNLAQWTTNHWEQIRSAAEKYEREVAINNNITLTLQAMRRSVTGESSPLHVENWDNMNEGVYSPIDRTGFRPTEAEQKRIAAARKAAETMVALVHQVQTNQTNYKEALQNIAQKFRDKLKNIQTNCQNSVEALKSNPLDTVTAQLQSISTTKTGEAKTFADALFTDINSIQSDYSKITNLVELVLKLDETIQQKGRFDPIELLWGSSGLIASVDNIFGKFNEIEKRMKLWPEKLKRINDNTINLARALGEDQLKVFGDFAKDSIVSFGQSFPLEVSLVNDLWSQIRGTQKSIEAGDVLSGVNDQIISRTLDNLVDGRVKLKYGGIALDDAITIRLRATNELTGTLVEDLSYEHEVGFMGAYGKPVVHFIFARATSGAGEAIKWKPNVAAGVEFHYQHRIREGDVSSGKKTWNWLNPGLGIHVASLDQGTDSVEIGTGLNVSLWDGLVAVGYGYNFAQANDRNYMFIGVNLLNALGKAKNGVFGK